MLTFFYAYISLFFVFCIPSLDNPGKIWHTGWVSKFIRTSSQEQYLDFYPGILSKESRGGGRDFLTQRAARDRTSRVSRPLQDGPTSRHAVSSIDAEQRHATIGAAQRAHAGGVSCEQQQERKEVRFRAKRSARDHRARQHQVLSHRVSVIVCTVSPTALDQDKTALHPT